MNAPQFDSFEEFWPFYVSQHADPVCRKLHFFGTCLFFSSVALGFLRSPRWFLLMPLVGYGPAWVGHFVFERNKPATFSYPVWSFLGDMRMFLRTLQGRMDEELDRAAAWASQS